MTKRVKTGDYLVRAGDEVDLAKWPTIVKPVYKSKKSYHTRGCPTQGTEPAAGLLRVPLALVLHERQGFALAAFAALASAFVSARSSLGVSCWWLTSFDVIASMFTSSIPDLPGTFMSKL